jgi:spore germination protein KC
MGCWDAEEVTNRIPVLAAGFDRTETGGIKVSAQVPIEEELFLFSGSAEGRSRPFGVLTAEGASVHAVIPTLQSKTQRTLFYGQLKTMVFSWELATDGLREALDPLRRNHEIPAQAHVYLVKDQASTMLNHSLWHKRMPANSLVQFAHVKSKADQSFSQDIWELARNIDRRTQDAFIPLLGYDQEEQTFIISGLGVFHQDRLVGELSGEETRMFGLLSGRSRNAYLFQTVLEHGGITMRRVRAKSKIRIKKDGLQPVVAIEIKARGNMGESTKMSVNLNQEEHERINQEFSAYLEREMRKTLKKLQDLNSDILALGEVYRINYPLDWEKTEWERLYPQLPVEIAVEFAMDNYGVMR